jgi:signal transduction histidine kinase
MTRVLVVEDSPTQARLLGMLLEEAGYAVAIAVDAESGFARLQEESFDLLLTDLVLPGASGFDLCRRIKDDPRLNRLPVVVLTSLADPVNVLRGLEAGADDFMTKNRAPGEILSRLGRILARQATDGNRNGRVVFLEQEFDIHSRRDQLVSVLLSAFEDVVHLNQRYEAIETALRRSNSQLQAAVRSEQEAHRQLMLAQSRLVQTEKLSALCKMVAGMTHEVNNPLAFLQSNLAVLRRDTAALVAVLGLYEQAAATIAQQHPDLAAQVQKLCADVDLGYILGNLDGLIDRSRNGLVRIQEIVKNLRDFARLDESELKEADVNDCIHSVLGVVRPHAAAQKVDIAAELAALPRCLCYPAKINQAVFNLLANAIDACEPGGRIVVRSRTGPEGIEIEVEDNGRGIEPEIRDKIFDPFFTTKPPGQGTGLGLSITYGIAQDHGGRLGFEPGQPRGTRFFFTIAPRQARPSVSRGPAVHG